MKIVMLLLMVMSYVVGKELPYNKTCIKQTQEIRVNNKLLAETLDELENLTYEQINVLGQVYNAFKDYGLENTGIAICYRESRLGIYLFDETTGDYGIMGVNLKTFLKGEGVTLSYWERKALASRLIINNDLNIAISIKNLKYWKKVTNNNWKLIWGSYNGGWRPNARYAMEILTYIKAFQIYFAKHSDIAKTVKGVNYVK